MAAAKKQQRAPKVRPPLVKITAEIAEDVVEFTKFQIAASRLPKHCYSDPYLEEPECNPAVPIPDDGRGRRRCDLRHICLVHKAEARCPGIDLKGLRDISFEELVDRVNAYDSRKAYEVPAKKAADLQRTPEGE